MDRFGLIAYQSMRMDSVELPDPTLNYNCRLSWGDGQADVAILPIFFSQASESFKRLIQGLDEQEQIRARRLDEIKPYLSERRESKSKEKEKLDSEAAKSEPASKAAPGTTGGGDSADKDRGTAGKAASPTATVVGGLRYHGGQVKIDIPSFTLLGDGSSTAASIPMIRNALNKVPIFSHRFVTLPLEDGMDM